MATESIASDEALLALLEQPDSRLRLALVPLFIRHPRLASSVAALVDQIEPKRVIELQTLYMAAVYLQRQWKTRLSLYLDAMTLLPDLFSQQMGLPAADVRYACVWHGVSPHPSLQSAISQYRRLRLRHLCGQADGFIQVSGLDERKPAQLLFHYEKVPPPANTIAPDQCQQAGSLTGAVQSLFKLSG